MYKIQQGLDEVGELGMAAGVSELVSLAVGAGLNFATGAATAAIQADLQKDLIRAQRNAQAARDKAALELAQTTGDTVITLEQEKTAGQLAILDKLNELNAANQRLENTAPTYPYQTPGYTPVAYQYLSGDAGIPGYIPEGTAKKKSTAVYWAIGGGVAVLAVGGVAMYLLTRQK